MSTLSIHFLWRTQLPLDHRCSQWILVDKQLIQCSVCKHLVKAPDNEKLNPEQSLEKHVESNCLLFLYPPNGTSLQKINRDCFVKGCKDIDPRVGPVHCDGCDQNFCLRHRHPSSHTCKSLGNDEQRKLDRKIAAQEKLAKTFAPVLAPKKRTVPAKTKSGGMVELMKIKSQAKGLDNIPATSRIYIYVKHPRESKASEESLPVYFDKKISVGRALDFAADICKVNNNNNVLSPSDSQRLELYKCPDMTVLDKSELLEKVLKNLDTVLLERQGSVSIEEE
ncbi:unnamed protein product [Mucor hiemalis]